MRQKLVNLNRDNQDWKYYFVNQYEMLQTVKCFQVDFNLC
jgi:hypothetical protein